MQRNSHNIALVDSSNWLRRIAVVIHVTRHNNDSKTFFDTFKVMGHVSFLVYGSARQSHNCRVAFSKVPSYLLVD